MVVETLAGEDANRPTLDANRVLISISKYNVNVSLRLYKIFDEDIHSKVIVVINLAQPSSNYHSSLCAAVPHNHQSVLLNYASMPP
jgi:hypothetical protein